MRISAVRNTCATALAGGTFLTSLALALAASLSIAPVTAQNSISVAGLWLDNAGKAGVEVRPCGGQMCGNIVWLREPLDPKGKPWTDILNPDANKRGRPVCGLQIIGGLKPAGRGAWEDGWVYDPEEGKTFNVELSLKDANTLTVFGYAGIRLLSETMHWRRLPPDNARCKA